MQQNATKKHDKLSGVRCILESNEIHTKLGAM